MAPTASRSKSAKKTIKKPVVRQLKKPRFGRRIKKHLKVTRRPLPRAYKLLIQSIKHLFKHWHVFLGITLIYLILTIVLVKGFGVANNVSSLKDSLQQTIHGNGQALTTGVTLFNVMLGSIGNATSDIAGAYQTFLLVTVSLALIWALRQTHAEEQNHFPIRDAFYKGEFPLVPFMLVVVIIGIELLPIIFANTIYQTVFVNQLAAHWYDRLFFGSLIGLLAFWSIFMISSSIFALYIVTLPDVRPFQAIRSARELVRFRRTAVLLKVLFLPIALLVLAAVIVLPLIYVWAAGVGWVMLVLNMFGLAIIHSYLYSLYRSLL